MLTVINNYELTLTARSMSLSMHCPPCPLTLHIRHPATRKRLLQSVRYPSMQMLSAHMGLATHKATVSTENTELPDQTTLDPCRLQIQVNNASQSCHHACRCCIYSLSILQRYIYCKTRSFSVEQQPSQC